MKFDAVVIGGGRSGCAAAKALLDRGLSVCIVADGLNLGSSPADPYAALNALSAAGATVLRGDRALGAVFASGSAIPAAACSTACGSAIPAAACSTARSSACGPAMLASPGGTASSSACGPEGLDIRYRHAPADAKNCVQPSVAADPLSSASPSLNPVENRDGSPETAAPSLNDPENRDGSPETASPSLNLAENRDGIHEIASPSLNPVENRDGSHEIASPSLNLAENRDATPETASPSLNPVENRDGSPETAEPFLKSPDSGNRTPEIAECGAIRIAAVRTANLGDEPLAAGLFVLATGKFFSRGLVADMDRVYEPVFGADVDYIPDRTKWYVADFAAPQPFLNFGVRTAPDGRVLFGGIPAENLYAVGRILAKGSAPADPSALPSLNLAENRDGSPETAEPFLKTPDSRNRTPETVEPFLKSPDSRNRTPKIVEPFLKSPDSGNRTPETAEPFLKSPDSGNRTPEIAGEGLQTCSSSLASNRCTAPAGYIRGSAPNNAGEGLQTCSSSLEQCLKCNLCTFVCPMMAVNDHYPGPKKAGPDGERYRLKDPDYYDYALKYCLNCKRCEVACPSGVKVGDIIQSARLKYAGHNLRDWALASTDLVGSLASPLAPLVNAALKAKPVKALMHAVVGVDSHRTFPEYSSQTFERWFRKHSAGEGLASDPVRRSAAHPSQAGAWAPPFDNAEGGMPPGGQALHGAQRFVTFYHGCYANYNYPQLGKDLVKLANAAGYGVHLMEKERCCGVALISNSFGKQARRQALVNLESMRKAIAAGEDIVTVSSTCTFTMRDEYHHVLGLDNADVRPHLSLFSKWLYERIVSGEVAVGDAQAADGTPRLHFKPLHLKVAYHTACHMQKLGWRYYTLELLKLIPGIELVELEPHCCGIAGTFGFKKENYAWSQAIGETLFADIRAAAPAPASATAAPAGRSLSAPAPADKKEAPLAEGLPGSYVVCTECETCKWQIEMSTGVPVLNPVSLLALALE